MARRLRLQNTKERRGFQRPVRHDSEPPNTDGFSLKFSEGKGILQLNQVRVTEGVSVARLELLIDNIAFPLDISRGVKGLANRRLKLHRLQLDISVDALVAYANARAAQNGWMNSIEIGFFDDFINVSLMYGPEGTAVPVSFRMVPVSWQNGLAFMVHDVRCYGAMPGPLLNSALLCVRELSGFTVDGTFAIPADTVKNTLLYVLPPRGWRIPSYDRMSVESFSLQPRRCSITLCERSGMESGADMLRRMLSMPMLKRFEELRGLRDVDARLAEGNLDASQQQLRALLDKTPTNPALQIRLAMLNISDASLRKEVLQQIRDNLDSWQYREDALAVVAHGAALSGDTATEMAMLERLFPASTPIEKLLAAMRIGELVGDTDTSTAIHWLEQAVSVRRDDPDALLALMELVALQNDVPRLTSVIPRWISVQTRLNAQTEALLEAGRLLLSVSQWTAAADYFKKCLSVAPENDDAAWGLAAALAGSGDMEQAMGCYEKLAETSRQKGAVEDEAAAIGAIGELWLGKGEAGLAVSRLHESIEIHPDSSVQLLLAEAMVALERYDQAALHYEEALEAASERDSSWGDGALALAELFFYRLEDLEAARYWVEQAVRVESVQVAAGELKIKVLEKQRKWSELAHTLERSLLREGPNASLETVARLAQARVAIGELTSAVSTIEGALAQNPEHGMLLDVYIDALRRQKDYRKLDSALQRRLMTVTRHPRKVAMLIEIGDLQLRELDAPQHALSCYRGALAMDENSLPAQAGIVATMRETGDDGLLEELRRLLEMAEATGDVSQVAETQFALAEVLIQRGDGKEAVALLQEAIPDIGEEQKNDALMKMGRSLLKGKEYALAKEVFASLRKGGELSDNLRVSLFEAEAAYHLGDFAGAYELAVAAGSGPSELRAQAIRILADASVHIGKTREALSILKRVAENLADDDAISLLEHGARLSTEHLRNIRLAQDFYESILSISPENEGARNRLLALLESSGLRAELARALVRFFGNKASGIGELKRAADFFLADGLYDEAVEVLNDAYELAPDVESARMLANALSLAGREDDALQVLSKIAREDEGARNALLTQYEAKGDVEAMLVLLSSAASKKPEHEVARLEKLAQLRLQKGEDLEAAGHYLEAAALVISEVDLRRLLEEVMDIALLKSHPQLYARAVDGISVVAGEEEMAKLKLSLAILYHRKGLHEEATQILESPDVLRAVPLSQLMSAVAENTQMKSLVLRVLDTAEELESWSEAEKLLTILLAGEDDPKYPEWLRRRAHVRGQKLNDREGAADDWMELFYGDDLDFGGLLELARLLEGLERIEDLLHVMTRLSKMPQSDVKTVLRTAELAKELSQRSLQKQLLRMAFERSASPDVARQLFALLDISVDRIEMESLVPAAVMGKGVMSPSAERQMLELQLLQQGETDRAAFAETLLELMKLFPNESHYAERLWQTLSRAEEWPLLAEMTRRRLQLPLAPEMASDSWMQLGRLYSQHLDDEEQASACFQKALETHSGNLQALMILGEKAFRQRDKEKLNLLLQLGKDVPWHPQVNLWKALLAEDEGRPEDAFVLFAELVDRAPQTEGAYEGYLRTVPEEGFEQHIRDALTVVRRKSGFGQMSAAIHRKAAQAFLASEQLDQARRHLEIALSLEPLDKPSLMLLVRIYEATGQASARAYTIEKLADLESGVAQIDNLVASARVFLDELRDATRARALLTRAAAISNSEPDVLLGLADCAWMTRDWARVTSNLERLRLVAPHLTVDPVRVYRFAAALSKTGEWPMADVAELLERTVPSLDGDERNEAELLLEKLNNMTGARRR
ncbi:MAG: tetratricopeptide repeat protein [Deltaproteobacteria bacterium]|nr:tetratricopeptide repeat protein [Deltaproteobacteria bacterium]